MIFRIGSREFFIERDDPRSSFFDFDRTLHSTQSQELWGMGLHIVISRL